MLSYKAKRSLIRIAKHGFLSFICVLNLLPLYWIAVSSLKNNNEMYTSNLGLPEVLRWENFARAWELAQIGQYFLNTLIYAIGALLLLISSASMAAFVLSRVKQNLVIYVLLTLGVMIPVQVLIIPEYMIITRLGLQNTYIGIVFVYAAIQFSLSFFILYGFMVRIPEELEEAAFMEGCGFGTIFTRITLPVTAPAISTVSILGFVHYWNQYILPLVLISDTDRMVIAQGIWRVKQLFTVEYGVLAAAICITIIPVVAIYTLFGEKIQKGFMAGAVKG